MYWNTLCVCVGPYPKVLQILSTYTQEQTTKECKINTLFIVARSIVPKTKEHKEGQSPYRGKK